MSSARLPPVPARSLRKAALGDVASLDRKDLVGRLFDLFRSPTYEPPLLPGIALELLTMSRNPNTSAFRLANLLETDAVMAAHVLRAAHSPLYARAVPVKTLQEAIVTLGMRTVTDIFFGVWSSARIFSAPGYEEPMNQVRRHALATAHLARRVCRHTDVDDDYAFLCGLFHDIGIALSLLTIAEGRRRDELPNPASMLAALHDAHAEIGGLFCWLWHLPQELRIVVEHHNSIGYGGEVNPASAAVRLAENLASRHGAAIPEDGVDDVEEAIARGTLGISDEVLAELEEEAEQVVASLE
jgi:putative nucleotidyltransferase with HDIG domain